VRVDSSNHLRTLRRRADFLASKLSNAPSDWRGLSYAKAELAALLWAMDDILGRRERGHNTGPQKEAVAND